MPSKQFAATQNFEANRGLIHKAVKQEEKKSHISLSEDKEMGYLWDKNTAAV